MSSDVRKVCENCLDPHLGSYGSGRFCTMKCARGFSTKEKRKEISKKTRVTLLRRAGLSELQISERLCEIRKPYTKRTREDRVREIYVLGSKLIRGQYLKWWLLQDGFIENDVCSECGTTPIWNNKPLTLELDHINGNRVDNRIENLRILCPNCHSQTETYKSKNTKTIKPYRVNITTIFGSMA